MPACFIVLSLLLLAPPPAGAPSISIQSLDRHFGELDGCFVLLNLETDNRIAINETRCGERLAPCSTFKIPHAILALQTGVVQDADTQFTWDGASQPVESWQRDHTLASAIENSVLWYFQVCARRIGADRMAAFLDEIEYGNASVNGRIDRFWLGGGSLRISADEQVDFLARLYRDELPVEKRAASIVRELIDQKGEFDFDGRLSGKTGSHWIDGRWVLGWFVGSVERDGERSVFATNVRGEDEASGMRAREIAVSILRDLDLIDAVEPAQTAAAPDR